MATEGRVLQVAKLLNLNLTGSNDDRKRCYAQLEKHKKMPKFQLCLLEILVNGKNPKYHGKITNDIRQVSGLFLKTIVWDQKTVSENAAAAIPEEVIKSLGDPDPAIRRVCGSIITTTVISRHNPKGIHPKLPNLVGKLMKYVKAPPPAPGPGSNPFLLGGLDALAKLTEDCYGQLVNQAAGRPMNALLPLFLRQFRHPDPKVREIAIRAINHVIPRSCNAMDTYHEQMLKGLAFLAEDKNPHIRKGVCHMILALLEVRAEWFEGRALRGITKYMFSASRPDQPGDDDQSIRKLAGHYWICICEHYAQSHAQHYLNALNLAMSWKLVPLLLAGMMHQDDADELQDCMDTCLKPDLDREMAPKRFQGRRAEPSEQQQVKNDTVRSIFAEALDHLCCCFKDKVIKMILPHLQKQLKSENWRMREAAILAIGAMATGCIDGLAPKIPSLMKYFFDLLDQKQHPLIKSITTWTISRFAFWVVQLIQNNNARGKVMLKVIFEKVLKQVLPADGNKRVQEAGISALSVIMEESYYYIFDPVVNQLVPILRVFNEAFKKYQSKNKMILYDAIITLTRSAPEQLRKPEISKMLLIPLVREWKLVRHDYDRRILPILETFTNVTLALGPAIQPLAPQLWERSIRMIGGALRSYNASKHSSHALDDHEEFIHGPLDLISALCDAIGPAMEHLIGQGPLSSEKLCQLLLATLRFPSPQRVLVTAAAAVGDLSRRAFKHIKPMVPQLLREVINNLDPQLPSNLVNNAIWATGELVRHIQVEGMDAHGRKSAAQLLAQVYKAIKPLLEQLVRAWRSGRPLDHNLDYKVVDNVNIAIGHLASVAFPAKGPPVLPQLGVDFLAWAPVWCHGLTQLPDNAEKFQAQLGLIAICSKQFKNIMQGMVRSKEFFAKPTMAQEPLLMHILKVIATWTTRPAGKLAQMFNMFLKHTLAFKLPGDERLFGQQALHQCMEFFKTRQNYFYEVFIKGKQNRQTGAVVPGLLEYTSNGLRLRQSRS